MNLIKFDIPQPIHTGCFKCSQCIKSIELDKEHYSCKLVQLFEVEKINQECKFGINGYYTD